MLLLGADHAAGRCPGALPQACRVPRVEAPSAVELARTPSPSQERSLLRSKYRARTTLLPLEVESRLADRQTQAQHATPCAARTGRRGARLGGAGGRKAWERCMSRAPGSHDRRVRHMSSLSWVTIMSRAMLSAALGVGDAASLCGCGVRSRAWCRAACLHVKLVRSTSLDLLSSFSKRTSPPRTSRHRALDSAHPTNRIGDDRRRLCRIRHLCLQ